MASSVRGEAEAGIGTGAGTGTNSTDTDPMPTGGPGPSLSCQSQLSSDGKSHDLDASGAFNEGWYGARPLTAEERLGEAVGGEIGDRAISDDRYQAASSAIVKRYVLDLMSQDEPDPRNKPHPLVAFAPADELRRHFEMQRPIAAGLSEPPTYSIVTSYFKHRRYFERCAESVADLAARCSAAKGDRSRLLEWVVVNDDPAMTCDGLATLVGRAAPIVRILSDGHNVGIPRRLNDARSLASGSWLLFLDCDDRIAPEAIDVLDHYVHLFPECRYISSGLIDIDEDDEILRFRRHEHAPTSLFDSGGNIAGHLKAIRTDLFDQLGGVREEFAGCQDYDFALRTVNQEPILLIPEYLYYYRWHHDTQSVKQRGRQENVANEVRRAFAHSFINRMWPEFARPSTTRVEPSRGVCIIRTQGTRLALLREALISIRQQSVPLTSCIIVHGPAEVSAAVEAWVRDIDDGAVVIDAPDLSRRRGYPTNIAFDYISKNPGKWDFFCFLDEVDVIYPFYTERLARAMELTGADIVMCQANERVPWKPAEFAYDILPSAALLAANFVPINRYIARTEILYRNELHVREDIDGLEDWDLLLKLVDSGAVFHFLNEVHCEFRLFNDGNLAEKRDQLYWDESGICVQEQIRNIAQKLGQSYLYRSLAEFDFSRRPSLSDQEWNFLEKTQALFREATKCPPTT